MAEFSGITFSGGGGPLFGTLALGKYGPLRIDLVSDFGFGISLDPFSFDIPCSCEPQRLDTIKLTSVTLGFFDITFIEWNLCMGECRGSSLQFGLSLGLDVKFLTWKVL